MMDFICIIILSPNYYVFLINILKIYSSALKKTLFTLLNRVLINPGIMLNKLLLNYCFFFLNITLLFI